MHLQTTQRPQFIDSFIIWLAKNFLQFDDYDL